MGKISVLNKHMAELIAAGEVIERPSSVIKELVENSLDAGAKSITVEIKNGGITFMRVSDDGCGIEHDDIQRAFLRHATSKLAVEEDLENISTFGFRGEAFPSIAAMARVEVLTRVEGSDSGSRYVIEGGEEVELSEVGCPKGTTVIVRDIFFNTPARMKFLKKDVSEGNAIAGVLDRLALGNPDVAIKFIRDGKSVLSTPGNGKLYDTIYAVLGREAANGMVEVDYSLNGISVKGFISKPENTRPSRALQYTFINSRFVKSNTVMAAVEQGFKGFIMVGKFPAFVLDVKMPFNVVDVNVHPAKIEVRFLNERPIFECVINGVKSALLGNTENKQVIFPTPKKPIENPFLKAQEPVKQENFFSHISAKEFRESFVSEKKEAVFVPKETVSYKEEIKKAVPVLNALKLEEQPAEKEPEVQEEVVSYKEEIKKAVPVLNSLKLEEQPAEKEPEVQEEVVSYKVIGELFATYILIEQGNALVLIDKHAAHERLLYEKIKRENGDIAKQVLMSPSIITLPKDIHALVCDNLELFETVGFSVEDFGSYSVIVREVPAIISIGDIEPIIFEIAEKININKRDVTFEKLDWLYHSVACRAAIKANDRSSKMELDFLVKELLSNPTLRHCPHGRPIYIQITKKELEKQFGRTL